MTANHTVYRNIIANFFGSAWTGLVALAFIPYYMRLMGAEAFAIIGVFIFLTNIISIADMGISPTLNRELASSSVHNDIKRMRDTLRSLEYVYFIIIFIIAFLLFSGSSFIAGEWLNHNKLPTSVIENSIQIMAIVIALHFLINFYSAGIAGLQLQIFLNTVNIIVVTLRYAGVIPIMLFFSPSPVVFFIWQLSISIVHVSIISAGLWRKLHLSGHKPSVQVEIIQDVWKFSLGVSAINILGVLSINMDKILLSKLLSLEEFGYYSVASIIAMGIAPRLASPLFAALYPRFTQHVKQSNLDEIISLYHKGCLLTSIITVPVTVFIVFYAHDILLLWTDSPATTEHAKAALILLSIGCFFNAVMYIPYALQLAYGWTKIALYSNAISLLCIVPLMIYLYPNYGVDGVAFSWLAVNSLASVIAVSIMHAKLLKGESLRWYLYDNGLVIFLVIMSTILLKRIFNGETLWQLGIVLACLYIVPVLSILSPRRTTANLLNGKPNYAKK